MPRLTVARAAEAAGTGLHSGARTRIRLLPAPSGSGIVFRRTDLGAGRAIPATLASVAATERRTALRAGEHRVDTVEHLLAAVMAREIDDLVVEADGPEVPIFDGSFAPFLALLDSAGTRLQAGRGRVISLQGAVRLEDGESRYRATPAEALRVEVELQYAEPVIGQQRAAVTLTGPAFEAEIAPARTFGFLAEVEPLRARGLLAGASADSAIVLAADRVLNTALRWPDECARHKVGDLIGDLALLGARLRASVTATRPSHRGNIAFARLLAERGRLTEE